MKTSRDSFFTQTISDLYPNPSSSAAQGTPKANFLTILPEELILRVFANLSTSTLRQICSVSKTFNKLASSDFIWQAIGESIFSPQEITTKPENISYKDFCKGSLCLTKLDNSDVVWQPLVKPLSSLNNLSPNSFLPSDNLLAMPQDTTNKDFCQEIFKGLLSNINENDNIGSIGKDLFALFSETIKEMAKPSDSYLKPRDPTFIHKVREIQLSEYKILSLPETIALCHKKDTASLIHAVSLDVSKSDFDFHHAAHQQVGDIKFDFLNCTDYVISFNSERFLMINNKLINLQFTKADCQLLIYADNQNLWFYNSDIGNDTIEIFSILITDLKLDDYTQLTWKNKTTIHKFRFGLK